LSNFVLNVIFIKMVYYYLTKLLLYICKYIFNKTIKNCRQLDYMYLIKVTLHNVPAVLGNKLKYWWHNIYTLHYPETFFEIIQQNEIEK
jgi:hypothetical protein